MFEGMKDLDFQINFDDFSDLEFDIALEFDTRIINPPRIKEITENLLKYEYALDLAKKIVIEKNCRYFCITNGSFISGDFIEALIVKNNFHVKKMTVSTLSLSQNNVDSFINLIKGGFVEQLNLIVSVYFFSHERHGLINYIYKNLDIDNKFQLAVANTHCKTCIIETYDDLYIVIHGSNNLRSSGNIEQFSIEESKELFDFNNDYQDRIIEKFKTINKPIRSKTLWNAIINK